MISLRAGLAFLLAAGVLCSHAAAAGHRSFSSAHSRRTHLTLKRARKVRGQQSIDSDRVTEIQQALIREHYLNGEASGEWDDSTRAAMVKYQADQGWQTKLTPDSRAIKKLGLGPDYSNAINAQSGNFAEPPSVSSIPSSQVAGFAAASGTGAGVVSTQP